MQRLVVPCIVALLSFATAARAQDDVSLAETIFEAGRAYYEQGNYEKALEQFEEAYRLDPQPEILYNIGQCHERLGQFEGAIEAYQAYIDESPGAEDLQAVTEKIKMLDEKLRATGLKLEVSEPDAVVFVDGEQVAVSPVPGVIPIPPGMHELEVQKVGFQDLYLKITIVAGHTQEITVSMVAMSPEEPLPGGPAVQKPSRWFWWTLGASALVGAAAAVTGSLALSSAQDASSAKTRDEHLSASRSSRSLALATDVLIATASLGAIISVVAAILWSRRPEDHPQERTGSMSLFHPIFVHRGAGLSLEMGF